MQRWRLPLLALILVAVAGAVFGWWWTDLRWRPHTLTKHEAEIATLLDKAGWVSPHLSDTRTITMISFRSCPDCIRFEREEFPRLQAAGVDTRVIMTARRSKSTASERSGVAELWANRQWSTYEAWTDMPVAAWTAAGLPSADADPARAALLERSRKLVDDLRPLLAANGVDLRYPTLVWRDAQGRLRGCACEKRETYRFIRQDLGVKG